MAEERAQRRLAAILAADVVGYSRMMGADEAGTLTALKAWDKDTLQPLMTKHGGRVVKLMGDGVLAEFASAVNAVECAVEMQRSMAANNEDAPEELKITLRIGINLGDVIVDGGDLYGDGVNVAARLEAMAEPGGICISDDAYRQVRDKLDIAFENAGEHQLKNIARPLRIFHVRASTRPPAPLPSLALPDKPSIAVLPFDNLSGDPEQEYFADGLTEDLIAAMGRFHSVAVISRNSAFHYKGRFPLARQVGEELGVQYLVEGSVRTSGNHIRVSAQLTETIEGKQLWAERYDRELEDVFVVQDEIVSAIAAELGVNLTVAAEVRTRSLPPEKLTAYDRLLKGRAAWWRGNVNEGFRLVEEAAAIDPTYAAAQAWLALQYAYQGFSASMDLTPEELGPKSRAIAKRALELDDRDPFVHMAASASFGFTLGGNKERALRHIEIATSMNPHDSEIMLLRAWHLAFHGRFDESLEVIQQVRKLHPFSDPVVSECLADLYYMIGDYEKCLAIYEDRSEAPPQVLVVFAACFGQLGASPEAQRCLESAANKATGKFDPHRFAKIQIAICARQREADLWRDGFRKVGLEV
jgi:TolB-like protein